MTFALLFALSGPAAAQQPVALLRGETALDPCLADPACEDRAMRLLGESMAEYGLALQSDPVATSALAGKGSGPVAEVRLDSVTLGPRNELDSGVPVPPAVPRMSFGWQFGSSTYDNPDPQVALGITTLPPIRMNGGVVSTLQFDASVALPIVEHFIWLGFEAGMGTSSLHLPLVGSDDQLETIEQSTGTELEGLRKNVCPDGCLDRFGQRIGSARIGLSIEPVPAAFAYGRIAVSSVESRLRMDFDDTTWGMDRIQLEQHYGIGVRPGDFYQLTAGAVVAHRPTALSTDDSTQMVKLLANSSWRFGKSRGWTTDGLAE